MRYTPRRMPTTAPLGRAAWRELIALLVLVLVGVACRYEPIPASALIRPGADEPGADGDVDGDVDPDPSTEADDADLDGDIDPGTDSDPDADPDPTAELCPTGGVHCVCAIDADCAAGQLCQSTTTAGVSRCNAPPTITLEPTIIVAAGATVTVPLTVADADGDGSFDVMVTPAAGCGLVGGVSSSGYSLAAPSIVPAIGPSCSVQVTVDDGIATTPATQTIELIFAMVAGFIDPGINCIDYATATSTGGVNMRAGTPDAPWCTFADAVEAAKMGRIAPPVALILSDAEHLLSSPVSIATPDLTVRGAYVRKVGFWLPPHNGVEAYSSLALDPSAGDGGLMVTVGANVSFDGVEIYRRQPCDQNVTCTVLSVHGTEVVATRLLVGKPHDAAARGRTYSRAGGVASTWRGVHVLSLVGQTASLSATDAKFFGAARDGGSVSRSQAVRIEGVAGAPAHLALDRFEVYGGHATTLSAGIDSSRAGAVALTNGYVEVTTTSDGGLRGFGVLDGTLHDMTDGTCPSGSVGTTCRGANTLTVSKVNIDTWGFHAGVGIGAYSTAAVSLGGWGSIYAEGHEFSAALWTAGLNAGGNAAGLSVDGHFFQAELGPATSFSLPSAWERAAYGVLDGLIDPSLGYHVGTAASAGAALHDIAVLVDLGRVPERGVGVALLGTTEDWSAPAYLQVSSVDVRISPGAAAVAPRSELVGVELRATQDVEVFANRVFVSGLEPMASVDSVYGLRDGRPAGTYGAADASVKLDVARNALALTHVGENETKAVGLSLNGTQLANAGVRNNAVVMDGLGHAVGIELRGIATATVVHDTVRLGAPGFPTPAAAVGATLRYVYDPGDAASTTAVVIANNLLDLGAYHASAFLLEQGVGSHGTRVTYFNKNHTRVDASPLGTATTYRSSDDSEYPPAGGAPSDDTPHGNDTSPVSTDPFCSGSRLVFHLAPGATDAIGTGTTSYASLVDIDNQERMPGLVDRGADEYVAGGASCEALEPPSY